MLIDLLHVETPVAELVLRGSLIYWFLLLMFRFVLRRDAGALGVADLLFVVVVADASQNAMSGSYQTVGEGFILVGTLGAWNYAVDWASYHWRPARYLTDPPPLLLIDRGKVLERNLRRQHITLEDLEQQLRLSGMLDVTEVRRAYLEGDGKISVVGYGPTNAGPKGGTPSADD